MRAHLVALAGMAAASFACVGDSPSNQPVPPLDAGITDAAADGDAKQGCGDTTTSHENCGSCGNVCASAESCFKGACGGDELVDVAAGGDDYGAEACVVTKSGTVFCWGANYANQLGADSGATTCAGGRACSPKALEVLGLSDATRVSVGNAHACAVRKTGTVVCWGRNKFGELGHANGDDLCAGTPCNRAPTQVVGLPANDPVIQVSAGDAFACALTKAGAVFCWGSNEYGRLGNTSLTPTTASSPVAVTNVQSGAVALAVSGVGAANMCAIQSDKTLRCWGYNGTWALGRDPASGDGACSGCYPTAAAPTLAGLTDVKTLVMSNAATVAVHSNGQAFAWGFYGFAVHVGSSFNAVDTVPGLPAVVALAAGQSHACGRTASGEVWCWGTNGSGELGNGTTTGEPTTCTAGLPCVRTAAKVAGVTADEIAAGKFSTVAISAHAALAWGSNASGQLGHSPVLDTQCSGCNATPRPVEGLPGTK